jgi:Outer membrane lipoprotein-sorting protein
MRLDTACHPGLILPVAWCVQLNAACYWQQPAWPDTRNAQPDWLVTGTEIGDDHLHPKKQHCAHLIMSKWTWKNGALYTLCLFLTAQNASAIDPKVESCIREHEPKTTAIQKIELRSTDRAGYEKLLVADIYLKRFPDNTSRLLAYFSEPDDIIGTRLLVIEKPPANEMYMYMPSLFKIRRISSQRISSSMYGSDFSYEDIERFYQMLSKEQPVQKADTMLDGKPMYVLESRPTRESGSKYESVVAYFNQQDCMVQRVDFFESGARLRKQLVTDTGSIVTADGNKLPGGFTMTDLHGKTETRLRIRQVEFGVPIADETFNPEHLKDFRGIR